MATTRQVGGRAGGAFRGRGSGLAETPSENTQRDKPLEYFEGGRAWLPGERPLSICWIGPIHA
eukprot:9391099-Alexandrium_andersonii.AAC.1